MLVEEVLSPTRETLMGREMSQEAAEGDRRLSRHFGNNKDVGNDWGCDEEVLTLFEGVGSTDTP